MESELIQIIAAELALFPPVADRVAVEVAGSTMTSTALQPNLMNVSMTFTLCSAPHIRTTLLAPSFGPGFPPQSHIPVLRSTNTLTP